MPKNIVICCDGTGNEVVGSATNILHIFSMLERNEGQLAYYDGGVGTLSDPAVMGRIKRKVRRRLDGAIGHSLRGNFNHAYRFLAEHYQPGDPIYLFGFSRGAYTVRALAGAIHQFGILRPELAGLSDYAWSAYSNEMKEQRVGQVFPIAKRFKKLFSVEQPPDHRPIRFLGVFDTVSSLGWITDFRSLPHTAHNPSVEHVRHAMAIDERRGLFPVNRFRVNGTPPYISCKEVWFAGVHSDVGGGYPDAEAGLAKFALQWMVREAEAHQLQINAGVRDFILGQAAPIGKIPLTPPNPMGQIHNSLHGAWNALELLPRKAWCRIRDRDAWHAPNLWRGRKYLDAKNPTACVHYSVPLRAAQIAGYASGLLGSGPSIEN